MLFGVTSSKCPKIIKYFVNYKRELCGSERLGSVRAYNGEDNAGSGQLYDVQDGSLLHGTRSGLADLREQDPIPQHLQDEDLAHLWSNSYGKTFFLQITFIFEF